MELAISRNSSISDYHNYMHKWNDSFMTDQPFAQIGTDVTLTITRQVKVPTLNTNDTITMDDLITILSATATKTDGTNITVSISGNMITFTTLSLVNASGVVSLVGIKQATG